MIKAVIIEDENHSVEALSGLLERYCPEVSIAGVAGGYRSGLNLIREVDPDVIFLDIQMPDGSGFRLLDDLKDLESDVIFTTAFDQYAIKAIRYSALDYLLKPILPDELKQAVNKVQERKSKGLIKKNLNVLLNNISQESQKIVLSTSEKLHVVEIRNILRCESDNYYTHFFFQDGSRLMISKTLKEVEELLGDKQFVRPHKSHLVNLSYINNFLKKDGGCLLLKDGSKIPVSRRKKEKIIEILEHL